MEALRSYQNVYNVLYDAVLIVDKHMVIHFINDSGCTLFGYASEELLGSNIELLIPESQRGKHKEHTSNYIKEPKHRQMETGRRLNARKKGGEDLPVSISLNPIEVESENFFCAIIRDLSELVRIEAKLLQTKKMESLGVLIGGVAHDINNIMTAVRGSIYLAKRKPFQSEKHLNTIDSQCEYATDIVQQMLIISKDDSIKSTVFSLSDALIKSKRLLKASISNQVDISFDFAVENAFINGSSTLLIQALTNLIINAKEATTEVPLPSISVALKEVVYTNNGQASKHYLCLSVADNGLGMDEATKSRIFEPFYTTKPSTKGTGLGLAIVYNVVQLCGGFVDVESSLNQGTTFKLYLPPVSPPSKIFERNTVPKKDESDSQNEVSILLVEDNKAVRRVNRDIIESLGYNTFSAKNGASAIKKAMLFRDDIHLIIMDISMPEVGGLQAAIAIRAKGNEVPIIFCSGNSDSFKPIEQFADKLHPFSIVNKPFNIGRLEGEIEDLLNSNNDT